MRICDFSSKRCVQLLIRYNLKGRTMKKTMLFLLFMFISINVNAATFSGNVTRIYPGTGSNGGKIHFRINNNDCLSNGNYFWFSIEHPSGKAWYSLILAAANTGKSISVNAEKCPDNEPVQVLYIYQNF